MKTAKKDCNIKKRHAAGPIAQRNVSAIVEENKNERNSLLCNIGNLCERRRFFSKLKTKRIEPRIDLVAKLYTFSFRAAVLESLGVPTFTW